VYLFQRQVMLRRRYNARMKLRGRALPFLVRTAGLVSIAVCLACDAAGQGTAPTSAGPPHYVVVISLGGFRWDYAARDGAKNLLAIGKTGVAAPQGMVPSFPASTWPNEWTLVTGLYPGHHGIVADKFFDPGRKAKFSSDDPKATGDASWYGGTPIWALAEKQGVKAACISWPGCTAQVSGTRPSYFPNEKAPSTTNEKLGQVTEWLRLPDEKRPRLILVYFSEAEDAGRKFGPDAPETVAAVRALDAAIGKLKAALDATRLPIDLVVVSDHGVARSDRQWITLDAQADLTGFDSTASLLYAGDEADRDRAYNQLKKASAQFIAYRLKSVPADLHLYANPRAGDPVVIAAGPYALRIHVPATEQGDPASLLGLDGLNVRVVPEMKGIFFAAGPDILEGKTVAPFENTDVFPWLAHLLGLTPPKSDGSLNVLSGTLRDRGGETDQ
jgi:alkaline phosphatase D